MTADRWQQVATVYEAVLALAPEARAEYLAGACRDDPELRQEVDSLLAHASRPVLVDGSVWDAAEGVIDIECAGDLPQGTRIGPYCVGALLGRGGMGQVYRARDMKLQRDVAVKILPERFVNDTGRVARFTLEAQILASLNHPNIGAIYGFEQSNHVHALILELIDAPTLAERIANGPLALDTALPIARQIVDALEAAHEHGIVHRDLKPANIKVKADGMVKVLDFGLAKLQEHVRNISEPVSASPPPSEIENSPITAAGMVLGTAAYMSPEQAEAEVADKRSDIWAFGCVLYEMLTGVRAYAGKAATSVNVLRDEPDWRAVQHFPAPVQRLLRRCLQKDRKKRLADIADARLELDDAVAATPTYAHSPPVSARRRERIGWIVLAAVAAVLGWLASSPRDRVPETRLEMVTPPTIDPLSLAVSPDGESVVFAAAGEQGVTQLWLRSLPAGSSRPLPHTARAASPFWSHDGKSLGFFADRKLKRLDLATGVVTILAESGGGGGGSWNASGTILFAPRRLGPILRVAASGGTPVPVTKLASNHGGHLHPQFLPDGRRFVFYARGTPEVRGIYVSALDGSQTRRILDGDVASPPFVALGHLLFVRQEKLFVQRFDGSGATLNGAPVLVSDRIAVDEGNVAALSVSSAGVIVYRSGMSTAIRQFVWLDRHGHSIGKVGGPDTGNPTSPSLSPDGRMLAMHRVQDGNVDVWLLDISRGALSRFTKHDYREASPVWSPDSRRIVFNAQHGSALDLHVQDIDGESHVLLADGHSRVPADWSADGRFLLYETSGVGSRDVWALPMKGNAKPFPVMQTPFDERGAQFSPDSRWIAYESDESGRFEIYAQPFGRAGVRQQLSTTGGAQPLWSRSGRELFYIANDGWLMAVPLAGSADGQKLGVGAPARLFRTAVGDVVQPAAERQYVASPDGRRFLMNTIVEGSAAPITVISNWDPERRR